MTPPDSDFATDPQPTTPARVWATMQRGNARFVGGTPKHPRQDVETRATLANLQTPRAALFGCSDSRLAAEIIFDLGLGDLFVVRNAGQVVSDSALGSLEYAVEVLGVSLIVVLGHDSCGAVRAAIDSQLPGAAPLPGHIRGLVDQIVPAISQLSPERDAEGALVAEPDAGAVGKAHLRATVGKLLESSEIISAAVADGRLGIVGANYRLAEGRAVAHVSIGDL
ncbi:carbonic anhydrase [Herbiconiux sp. KACC 21604]|uniref:carbonic anhydrase n=1 Tax=unclassified Herbiconiux TaxID=2618217 RepID=UPI0014920DD5|nr:carbonic anhydrase [Herbiconiux sp. SALV-R1]QJU53971.1 carbonic anhydrase [Herbiconiux sp. SALV-R1]WPO84999.1 carbonic anhydrase [Herbiconiux sp. KACC 21604]